MFNYKSYEEATKMKRRISDAIFTAHDSVVSVGTEQEKSNGLSVYSVKIGLKNLPSDEECNKILDTLKKANIISESPDKITPAQKHSLFKHIGLISAQSNSSANLTFMYINRAIPKPWLAVAVLAGAAGLAVWHKNTH